MNLLDCAENVHSQNGEDGILREILRRLEIEAGHFVEFGAWNGWYLSNTYALLEAGNWQGVYIEGDKARFAELQETQKRWPNNIVAVNAMVDYRGIDTLDNILMGLDAPVIFDVLSIDIDGFDWQVWHSLRNFAPKVVVIECNSLILPGVWQIHEPGVTASASFTALIELGKRKGYTPVAHTGNIFFVLNTLVDKIGLSRIHLEFPETLFNYKKHYQEMAAR